MVKGIKKGEKGYASMYSLFYGSAHFSRTSLLIIAADISPIDIVSHLPVLSEEAKIPYIFVSSKEELGHFSSTKRPTSCVMICPHQKRKLKEGTKDEKDEEFHDLYKECYSEVEKLDTQIVF